MLRTSALALSLLLGAGTQLAAQTDRWQVALDDDQHIWEVQLVRLDGDSLVLMQADTLVRVPVEHINEIRLVRSSDVEVGADGGAGAVNALAGGDDEVYDLKTLQFADRLRTVQKILLYHPTTP
jgi:hypothetical protein